MIVGANRFTGKKLIGVERVVQSINTTLSTPINGQPGQRAYGTKTMQIVSQPANEDQFFEIFEQIAIAFDYEPEGELLGIGISEVTETGNTDIWYRFNFVPEATVFRAFIGKSTAQIEMTT